MRDYLGYLYINLSIPQEIKVSSLVVQDLAATDQGLILARREKIRFFRSKHFPEEIGVRERTTKNYLKTSIRASYMNEEQGRIIGEAIVTLLAFSFGYFLFKLFSKKKEKKK